MVEWWREAASSVTCTAVSSDHPRARRRPCDRSDRAVSRSSTSTWSRATSMCAPAGRGSVVERVRLCSFRSTCHRCQQPDRQARL